MDWSFLRVTPLCGVADVFCLHLLLDCSLCWFLGVARLVLPSPCNTQLCGASAEVTDSGYLTSRVPCFFNRDQDLSMYDVLPV